MGRALLWLCMCALLAPWLAAQTPAEPALLLMPESRLPTKRSVPVFGQKKIAYYDTGSGPVIVLVHGFGSEAPFVPGARASSFLSLLPSGSADYSEGLAYSNRG